MVLVRAAAMAESNPVDTRLAAYARGEFEEPSGVREDSGWSLTLASGRTVTRAFLRAQAAPLIALGPDAVEPLIRWVATAPDPAVRYIAIWALEEITHHRPPIGHLAAPDADTLARAAREWRAAALKSRP